MSTKCSYCGGSVFGACGNAPRLSNGQLGNHKHNSDGQHCVYCGSSAYGACGNAPRLSNGQLGNHEH